MRATFALTLLLGCLSGILAEQPKLDTSVSQELVMGCLKENGVTSQDLADLQTGKVKAEDAKDNVKCSTQCILVKTGFMDSTGKLLTDKIKSYYEKTSFKDLIAKDLDRCSVVKGANACDTAFKILSCFQGSH